MSLDYLLARLGPGHIAWKTIVPGGKPKITREDILAIASEAQQQAFHAIMAKYAGDEQSELWLLRWLTKKSIAEWNDNRAYETIYLQTKQLKLLTEVAVLGWINPRSPHALNARTRSAYMRCNYETYRKNFAAHYAFLMAELNFLEREGLLAILDAKRR